ncbi:phosphoribosylaminoimidazolesuccinocarboxamide synthase [Malassezia vespertilionis]|uniref:Phosphoribosylaminoimidazole-succinocarboxamide synthase n=1 Tax=Malassezia vespertilionis TaxID=2020962 RepID=A0A2N1JHB1_9BASI|nr:phosphoribosylaminoimidazolesuccinocarboxamide synthase [Malassezia vespertilionis]PKI85939.1 Ade1p [Malassezia vespertilionis]WFD05298.1 phosphoribosylaminoimidazolesuccinocarboxamide synthase [Malassezia vespertilionis]
MAAALTQTDLPLPLVAKGKVRDVYDAEIADGAFAGALLFIATDRISAFDVVLQNGIPDKGRLLHGMSSYWFDTIVPTVLPSHVLAATWDAFPQHLQQKLAPVRAQVDGRAMLVRRANVIPIEAIVRGYITGSGWAEYQRSGTVHGIKLPEGLQESDKIPGGPLFTPSTKAAQGDHDENIHPDRVAEMLGANLAKRIADAACALYSKAAQHALQHGIILADTKFEFGLVPADAEHHNGELLLVDEVLTPDSSRFWSAADYAPGCAQASFDKQYVRDWMKHAKLDKAAFHGTLVTLPPDVVAKTHEKYAEAYDRITGRRFV